MASIDEMKELTSKLKEIFRAFFHDKYDEDTSDIIIKDLSSLIRNKRIKEILFCFYDNLLGQITQGYIIELSYNPDNINRINHEISINTPALSDRSVSQEKLLLIKLNEQYVNDENKRNEVLKSLDNKWDFTGKPDIETESGKNFFNTEDLNIKIGGIYGPTN
jgi:hypothetical protein